MGACASRPKEENGPSPVAPPAEDSSIHDATTNPIEAEAAKSPLVDLSETKPEETSAEVSTPTTIKGLAPALSQAPTEAPAEPKKEQKEKAQETEESKAKENKEEESKATN